MASNITFPPSPQAQVILDRIADPRGGNIIVDAKAGCGKTTLLEFAAPLFVAGGRTAFVGAYNTKMAKELKERLGFIRGLRAATFHAAGFNQLNFSFRNMIKGDPDPNKVKNIIEAMVMSADPMERSLLDILSPAVADSVSMAKQRGILALPEFPDTEQVWMEMLDHFDLLSNLPEEAEGIQNLEEHVVRFARAALLKSNEILHTIDFDDMVYLPLQRKLRFYGNDWVAIDEAQDTNPTRRAMAEKMLKPGGRLIAVGDPCQAIYGFSGADNDSLEQIQRRFNAVTMPLSVTYRCGKNIVAHANQWVPEIRAGETAHDGTVRVINYEEILDVAKPGDAILCRYNKYLVNLCFKFIRAGVPAKIEGRAIGLGLVILMKKYKAKDLETLAGKIVTYMEREVKKLMDAKKEAKADILRDKCETVLVLIQRAQEEGLRTPKQLMDMTLSLFDDKVVDAKNMVTLCSVHRSKGLEWDRVFILGREELMGKQQRQQWQTEQEFNLIYVAVTRAKQELVEVVGVREENKQHTFETAA